MDDSTLSERLVTTVVALYRDVHAQLRAAIDEIDGQALNWTPGSDTNSIGTLIVHLVRSEGEMLRSVCGLSVERQRDAEFAARPYTREELVALLEMAERDLDQLSRSITAEDLQALRSRSDKPTPQSGLFWLLRNYGHAREHLAHVQLTRQLYGFAH